MKNKLTIFLTSLFTIALFALSSCNNLLNPKLDDEGKTNSDAKAQIKISLSNVRTILPTDLAESDITKAELLYKLSSSTGDMSTLGTWTPSGETTAIAAMKADTTKSLDVGTYNFTINLYIGTEGSYRIVETGSITSKGIVAATTNNLTFTMAYVGSGDLALTLKWTATERVTAIKAGLFNAAGNAVTGYDLTDITPTTTDNTNYSATYSKTDVPVGSYMITFVLYNGTKELNTLTDFVEIASECTTSKDWTLSDVNTLYTITYVTNEGTWVTEPTTTSRNANTGVILPTSSKITKTDYTFGGWYETEGFTGDAVTTITAGTTGDKTFYAQWNPILFVFSSDASFTLATNNVAKNWTGTTGNLIEYSTDNSTWEEWHGTESLSSSTADSEGKYNLYLRGRGNSVITGTDSNYKWVLTPTEGYTISCSGNIENLLDYATVAAGNHPSMGDYCYANLFYGCDSLATAPELPTTTLAEYCYKSMFYCCTSLTETPELPATTLAEYCYKSMFYRCTSLTETPELPATTLKASCYFLMFYECTSLKTAPALPATTLADYCYYCMFGDCTSLETPPALTVITLADSCYGEMFNGCTSLKTSPALPATTLVSNCYYNMFLGCTSLKTPPALPATTLADACYYCMFGGCTSLETAPVLPATTLAGACYYEMFRGCTSLITPPTTLPATNLAECYYCYYGMFQDCTSLTKAPTLPATTLVSMCYESMFSGCISLNTLPELPATTLDYHCYNCMFLGCTQIKIAESSSAEYPNAYRIPTSGEADYSDDTTSHMFESTGGDFTGDPDINTIYYTSNTIVGLRTVTFNANGGSGTMAALTIVKGASATLTANTFTRDGYAFNGWNTASDGSGTDYANEASYTMGNADVTLYAKWIPTHTVTFNANDGSGTMTALTIVEGASATLTANTFTRDGYAFNGWNTASDGSGTDYANEASYTANANVTLYAQWKLLAILLSSDASFKLKTYNSTLNLDVTLEYSTDTSTWTTWEGVEISSSSTAIEGKYNLYLRGRGNSIITGNINSKWVLTPTGESKISCSGNIETLLDYATVAAGTHPEMGNNCYQYMFSGCTALITPPALPARSLAEWCYNNMFHNCTSLTTAPALPATTLEKGCYGSMFENCPSLTTLPELPATTLKDYCYCCMFQDCTKIKMSTSQSTDYPNAYTITPSGSETSAEEALLNMFYNTGGSFNVNDPTINTTYYTSNTIIPAN